MVPVELREDGLYADISDEVRRAVADLDPNTLPRYPLKGFETEAAEIERIALSVPTGDLWPEAPIPTRRAIQPAHARRQGKRAQRRADKPWRRR